MSPGPIGPGCTDPADSGSCWNYECNQDSDCTKGANGRCGDFFPLPSVYYYCHTPDDTCTDDSDCTGVGCNFDTKKGYWACGGDCGPVPP
jgi:hypothetical protein